MNNSDGNAQAGNLNKQDLRMRHHEVIIELRRSKDKEQKFRRRNIDVEAVTSPRKEVNDQSSVRMSVEEIVVAMNSEDEESQLLGTKEARKMLCWKHDVPIDLMINHGIVPICIGFLQNNDNPKLQFEAAWVLVNITSGTSAQTHCVIEQDGVPHLVALLESTSIDLADQAVWALGNIAGDGPAARDIVIENNVIDIIVSLINNDIPISFLRNIVWLMMNLCDNEFPLPPFEQVKRMLPVLSELLISQDIQVVCNACWAISYVTSNGIKKVQAVVDTDAVPRLVNLLQSDELKIITPALRCVGNIVAGTDRQTDLVIASGCLPILGKLLQHSNCKIVTDATYTLSNIMAGNKHQTQAVYDTDIFQHLRHVLIKGNLKAQKEAAWAVTNATLSATPNQVLYLIEKSRTLKPYIDLLDCKAPKVINVVLSGLSNLLTLVNNMGIIENLCLMIDELGGLDKLKALQQHANEKLKSMAVSIIETHFTIGDDAAQTEDEVGAEADNPGG